MALKFRRGTTAQQSGSLAFGEPYVNTTLGTLVIGGANGDIILSSTGTGSTGNFGAISGSGLDITGNANIAGNLTLGGAITIGDASADTVNVVASLSSSLIPQTTNTFDLGSATKAWRDLYISTGSIKFVDTTTNTVVGTLSSNTGGDFTIAGKVVASGLEISSGSGVQLSLTNTDKNTDYHIRNNSAGNFTIFNPLSGKVILSALSGSSNNRMSVYIGGDMFISGNLDVNTNCSITASIFTGSLWGIGNVYDYSSSVSSRLVGVEGVSASAASALNTVSGAFATTIGNLDANFATDADLNSLSGAVSVTIANLDSIYATDSALNIISGGFTTRMSNIDTTISNLSSSFDSRLDVVENVSASAASALNSLSSSAASTYAKVGAANTFNGSQIISGSLTVTQDLVIGGSASIQHVTSSQLNIGTNIITVNTIDPSVRFGGLAVIDSGSSPLVSGSFLYDSVQDEFVFVHKGDGTNITSSHFLVGPETYNDLGNETYLSANKVLKSKGNEHIVESNITDNGTTITLGSNTSVTGTLVATGTSLVSASAQIDITSTTGYSTFSSSIATTNSASKAEYTSFSASAASGLNSLSGAVATTLLNLGSSYATDAELSAVSSAVALRDAGQDTTISTLSSSVNSRLVVVEGVSASAASALNSVSGAFATTIGNLGSTYATDAELSTVSGAFATTIGNLGSTYATDAELSSVSGAIATRDAGQDSTISTISSSVNSRLLTLEGKDITITLTGDVTGTGTITDLGNVSFATTVAADSVALGTDTTGNYVGTITAGTGVSTTGASTGEGIAHTISIGQAVATSSNVQFNSLGIGMAASATAGRIDATNDIVAFSSSDIRFKENIKPIENPIEKIRKISGNTYDWKEENKIEHGYEGNDVGVIAQEIEAVLPQLVQTRESGYKAVKYDKLVALLIEGIKEQQLQIEKLQLEVEGLKKQKGL